LKTGLQAIEGVSTAIILPRLSEMERGAG
jgi:hypothetical protein